MTTFATHARGAGWLWAAALAASPIASHGAGIPDAAGDFLPTFAGSTASKDLDVLSVLVSYNASTDIFTFTSTQAGNVGSTPTGFYVWGVNKGAGTAAFAANGLPGIKFDTTVILRPGGQSTAGGQNLPAGAVTFAGPVITAVVSGSFLASTGFAKSDYTFNLWPRDGAFSGFAAISDFAPDAVSFTALPVPEPKALALMAAGLGLLAWRRRRQR